MKNNLQNYIWHAWLYFLQSGLTASKHCTLTLKNIYYVQYFKHVFLKTQTYVIFENCAQIFPSV